MQDKSPELIDGMINNLYEKVLEKDSLQIFHNGICIACKKTKEVRFMVKGKDGIPKLPFCSSKYIRKELTVTRAKDWSAKTNPKKDEEGNDTISSKKK